MDVEVNLQEYFSKMKLSLDKQLSEELGIIQDLYQQRLWHQLTEKMEKFILNDNLSSPMLLSFYENFVKRFWKKLNPFKFVLIAIKIFETLPDSLQIMQQIEGLYQMLDSHQKKLVEEGQELGKEQNGFPEGQLYTRMELAHYKLLKGDLTYTQSCIQQVEKAINQLDSVDSKVHGNFYRVCSDYYKVKGDFTQYYRNGLLYLACVSLDDLPSQQKLERAHDLAIAALLSPTIYNFGDLLMHPISNFLKQDPHQWLYETLLIFHSGEIQKFESLTPKFESGILLSNMPFLHSKLCLMTLIEGIFQKAGGLRTFSFTEVASSVRLSTDEVEHLVMKAMSLALIRGTIDQVSQTITINWVQPRYVAPEQLPSMLRNINYWHDKVSKLAVFVENSTPELFM